MPVNHKGQKQPQRKDGRGRAYPPLPRAMGGFCHFALDIGCTGPFQHMSAAPHAPHGDRNGMESGCRIGRQENDLQQPARQMLSRLTKSADYHPSAATAGQPGHQIREEPGARNQQSQNGPAQRTARQQEPPADHQQQDTDRHQTAPHVVPDPQAIKQRQPVPKAHLSRPGHLGQKPGEQLPVTAHPAMPTTHIFAVARWKTLIDDDVARQRRTTVQPFPQIVAQQVIFRNASFKTAGKTGDVIYALAHEIACTDKVLIHIADGSGIDIDRGIAAKQSGEKTVRTMRGDLDPRLHHGIAGNHPAQTVKNRPVQRMGQSSGHPCHAAGRQPCIDIGRHDKPCSDEQIDRACGQGEGAAVSGLQEMVEFLQLSALSLPGHPASLRRVISAVSV